MSLAMEGKLRRKRTFAEVPSFLNRKGKINSTKKCVYISREGKIFKY